MPLKVKTVPAKADAAEAKATIGADAQKIVDDAAEAYGKLKSLDLVGTFTGEFEAAGQKQGGTTNFTSSFEAPNKFRHARQGRGNRRFDQRQCLFLLDVKERVPWRRAASKEKIATRDLPGYASGADDIYRTLRSDAGDGQGARAGS